MEMTSEEAMRGMAEGFTAATTNQERDSWRIAFMMGMTGFIHAHAGRDLDMDNPNNRAYFSLRSTTRTEIEDFMRTHAELTPLEHLTEAVAIVRRGYEAVQELYPSFRYDLEMIRALEGWVTNEPLVDQAFATEALQRAELYPHPVDA